MNSQGAAQIGAGAQTIELDMGLGDAVEAQADGREGEG